MSLLVDIWEGSDGEPTIFHGKTLTSKVSLRDVCVAINKYAFVASPYPLLISAEVHCGVEQQERMVDIMTSIFGDSLIQAPVEGRPVLPHLPSPEDLKHKILLKVRPHHSVVVPAFPDPSIGEEFICRREARPGPSQEDC